MHFWLFAITFPHISAGLVLNKLISKQFHFVSPRVMRNSKWNCGVEHNKLKWSKNLRKSKQKLCYTAAVRSSKNQTTKCIAEFWHCLDGLRFGKACLLLLVLFSVYVCVVEKSSNKQRNYIHSAQWLAKLHTGIYLAKWTNKTNRRKIETTAIAKQKPKKLNAKKIVM